MSIHRIYPFCSQENPSKVKEFLSGFFYCGSHKYTILPSNAGELKLRQDLNEKSFAKTALKITLAATGIIPLIAALYKLVEWISSSRKKIILEQNEGKVPAASIVQPKVESEKKVDAVVNPILNPINKIEESKAQDPAPLKSTRLDFTDQAMTKEECEKRLKEMPAILTISLQRSALIDHLWLAEILRNRPEIDLEVVEDQQNMQVVLEKDKVEALSIFAARNRSRNFAEFLFESYADAWKNNPNVQAIKECFLETLLKWAQLGDLIAKPQEKFLDHVLLALSFIHDEAVIEAQQLSLKILVGFVVQFGNPEQLIKILHFCKTSPLLSKEFIDHVSGKQLKDIKEHFKVPDDVVDMHKEEKIAFLIKDLCQILVNANVCLPNVWLEHYVVFEKLAFGFPAFTKENIQSKIHLNAKPSNCFIPKKGMEDLIFSLSLWDVVSVLNNDHLNEKDKIEACQLHYEFIKKLERKVDYVSCGSLLAQLNLSEKNLPVVLQSLNAQGVQAFLETILETNESETIKKTFKWFLANKDKVKQVYPGLSVSILESIDTVEKAVAIYQVSPSKAEMKTFLLEGIQKAGKTYKPTVSKQEIEQALAKQ